MKVPSEFCDTHQRRDLPANAFVGCLLRLANRRSADHVERRLWDRGPQQLTKRLQWVGIGCEDGGLANDCHAQLVSRIEA
jgi:hypothetical protein